MRTSKNEKKQVIIIINEDGPETYFEGEWRGRDVRAANLALLKGYKKMIKAKKREV